MKARQGLDPPSENDAVLAETLGKIYKIALNPTGSAAQQILNKAKLDQLLLHLLSAPEDMLPPAC